jgi:hypothetical protein
MDLDTIQPGDDFIETIQRTIASCDVLIAVTGKQWLEPRSLSRAGRGFRIRKILSVWRFNRRWIAKFGSYRRWWVAVHARIAGLVGGFGAACAA